MKKRYLFEKVFHRLHIMISGAFDILDPLGILLIELLHDTAEDVVGMFTQHRHLDECLMPG